MEGVIVQDAAACTSGTMIPVNNIAARVNPAILNDILNDLKEGEIISLVFLTTDKDTDFQKVLEEIKNDPCTCFLRLPRMNVWAERLIESLMIIGNKYVITRMAFNASEIQFLENLFVPREHNISSYLNKAIKSLYFLCENLDNGEAKRLIDEVNNKLGKPSDVNSDKIYLELHILEWLQEKYISINPDKFDLNNLLKNLKSLGYLINFPTNFNFEYWEIPDKAVSRNEQDSEMSPRIPNNKNSLQYSNNSNSIPNMETNPDISWSSPDHLKLCIIINQMNFTDKEKFKSREKGSQQDEKNLERTFKDCGFEIKIHQNFSKQQMMKLLDSLNNKSYSKYGAIFICILSHGFKGEVVFSDDHSIPIDTIKDKFCCRKLRNVFKFLILQCCQGEKIGLVEEQSGKLVHDGPSNYIDPRYRMHFCLFHATVQDFAAIRDEEKGSWFIQDLCKQIQEANEQIKVGDLIIKVKAAVTSRRGRLPGHYLDAVQVPELAGDTTTHPYILTKVTNSRRFEGNV